jgi:23S rRNA pseudouridine2604 synthase
MAKVTKRMFEDEENVNQAIRINKFLSDSGVCSRREADTHVEKGDVTIDGVVAVMGSKVLPHQTVVFCGKEVQREEKMVLIALNKPQGIVCTTDQREPDNIIDFLKYGKRIYPIGRLDKDSEGLILLTNNGDIVNKILRAGNHHEKEYIVKVNKAMTSEFLKGMSNGVPILDTVTRPCTIEALDKTTFRIILTQGLNRQIRRMCEYFGYRVLKLQRVRIMNVRLGHLQLGGYRNLTDYELEELKELIQDSYNHTTSDEVDDEMVDVRVSDKKIHQKNTSAAGYKKKEYKGKNFAPSKDGNKEKKSYHSSKDTVKAASKDASKSTSKYGSKDASKSTSKYGSKDVSKSTSKYGSKDASKSPSKYGSKDASKSPSKYSSNDAPKSSSKYGSKDASKSPSKFNTNDASNGGTKFVTKGKWQDSRSVGQGKKEYGNAGQKTKNYRTNRTSR